MMKINIELIKKDMKKMIKPVGCILIYIVIVELIFDKVCPSRIMFGIPCAGCGITRAMALVLQGKFIEATKIHPFWIPLVVGVILFLWQRYCIKSEKLKRIICKAGKACCVIILIACIVYYVYRMARWFPYVAPMQYDSSNIMSFIRKLIGR